MKLIIPFRKSFHRKVIILLSTVFLTQIGNSQINLQTGSATFSLPMFNWQDHKSALAMNVGLSYTSGNGLKVTDVASEVGQGWSLIAGGVITRMQVGEPDDQVEYGKNESETFIKKYPNGYLYADRNAYDGCPTALTKYPLYKAKNKLYKQYNSVAEDRQLDYFAFQFNGKAGMFVLNAADNNPEDPSHEDTGLSLGDTKIKIRFQRTTLPSQGQRTTIQSFTIQDVDGLIYKFATHGVTRLLDTKYSDKSGQHIKEQPKFEDGEVYYQNDFVKDLQNPEIITSWYLTEITDPLTGRQIKFNYGNEDFEVSAGTDLTYNKNGDYATVSYKKSKGSKQRLVSIIYPDGHFVDFHYDKNRIDFPGTKALTSVDITYNPFKPSNPFDISNQRSIAKYIINSTYFIYNRIGTPVTVEQERAARLCLKSVQKIGPDLKEDSPPYIFDYYTGSNNEDDFVPPPFYFKKDIWGYYNGLKSTNTHGSRLRDNVWDLEKDDIVGLCFLREIAGQNNTYNSDFFNVKPEYAKNGLLKQIIFPTGGTLTYGYKQNKQLIDGLLRDVGGVHVFETRSTDGGYSNGCDNPIITSYNYVLNQAGESSSLWGWEVPRNVNEMYSRYEPKDKKYKIPIFSGSLFGKCTYDFLYPGILSLQQATNLSWLTEAMQAIGPALGIMGSVSTVWNAVKVFSASTGVGVVVSLVMDVIMGVFTVIQTCQSQVKEDTNKIYYNIDLNSSNPLPTQFKRVEIIEGSGIAGKTVHEFTSDADYDIWEMHNDAFSSKQRFASWAYGLPLSTTIFKEDGAPVRRTTYKYDTTKAKTLLKQFLEKSLGSNFSGIPSNLLSCKCNVKKTISQKSTEYNDPAVYNASYVKQSGNSGMDVEIHGYYTGRLNLVEVKEEVYNENNPALFVETKTAYEYNNGDTYNFTTNYVVTAIGNYEVKKITTTKSNGDILEKRIDYPTDLHLNNPVMDLMVQNNIVSLPVQTSTYQIGAGTGISGAIEDSKTEFIQVGGGAIKPSRQLEMRYSKPGTPVGNNYTEVKKFTYDGDGNLVKSIDEGVRMVSNLYDYFDKYVAATVINADVVTTKIAYTSFETEKLGGWALTGSAVYSTTSKVTGVRGLQLTSGVQTLAASSLQPAVSYRLSFWATAPLSVSGGGTLLVSAPTINGFTYYEYEFPAGISTLSITGNGAIDELRLYPKTSRMSTVTYDPIIGKTSECDANNRITYYEYDNLGRMRFIRDEKRNIVKMYEYNNVSKQNGCPGIYYSKYTKEVFQPVCSTGYKSRPYVYIIPADKYSSTISQEDADAKVQKELLELGQITANANAFCISVNCNEAQSVVVYPEDCAPGYKGQAITYTVPAGRYCDTLSIDSLNKLALADLEANAQAYANDPLNQVCVLDNDPQWEADETAQTQCKWENGQAYIFILATDVNPNSLSFGSTAWMNTGEPGTCPPPNCSTEVCSANGPDYKCINGLCEQGIKVYTGPVYRYGMYYCSYHYEWLDGSVSNTYYEGGAPTQIICIEESDEL